MVQGRQVPEAMRAMFEQEITRRANQIYGEQQNATFVAVMCGAEVGVVSRAEAATYLNGYELKTASSKQESMLRNEEYAHSVRGRTYVRPSSFASSPFIFHLSSS